MALTSIVLTSVTPRGGVFGVTGVILGSGFGLAQGTVRFDPNSENVLASITVWGVGQIDFVVPVMNFTDRFYDVLVTNAAGDDAISFKWWVPAAAAPNAIDYQYPGEEAGTTDESVDEPTRSTAADFNRLLDRVALATTYTAAVPGDWDTAPPTTVADAINRLAAAYAASHAPVP